jgi:sporulation protein YlmC with PRC-barrel domain
MKQQLIIGVAALSLIAGSALAENANNMGKTDSNSTMNKSESSTMNKNDTSSKMDKTNTSAGTSTMNKSSAAAGSGFTMAANASAPVKYGEASSSNVMSSKLIGLNVYNNENQSIGEIKDLAIDGNNLTGVVVSVGGFLGVGEKYVLLDPSSIALQNDNGKWKAHINTSKEDLKSAPKFTYNESKSNKG